MIYRVVGMYASNVPEGGKTYLFFEIFTDLIIQLELFVELIELIFVKIASLQSIIGGRSGWGKEVEERVGRTSLPDKTRTVRVYDRDCKYNEKKKENDAYSCSSAS